MDGFHTSKSETAFENTFPDTGPPNAKTLMQGNGWAKILDNTRPCTEGIRLRDCWDYQTPKTRFPIDVQTDQRRSSLEGFENCRYQ